MNLKILDLPENDPISLIHLSITLLLPVYVCMPPIS